MMVKEESEKAGFKLNIKNAKIMATSPVASWKIAEMSNNKMKSENLIVESHQI